MVCGTQEERASLLAQSVKNLPAMQETWVWFLDWEDTLEKDMATHSSILAWGNPMDRETWRATVHGVARVAHEWVTFTTTTTQPVPPKGDQSWVFIGRTDAEAETPILWPPHAKSWLIGKDPDAGRDWVQEEKGTTEDEMAGWHHRLDGYQFEWSLRNGDGQEGLACCDSWGCKESDTTERLNWTEMNYYPRRKIGPLSTRNHSFQRCVERTKVVKHQQKSRWSSGIRKKNTLVGAVLMGLP